MVESFTKKELGEKLINIALSKLDQWTLRELKNYSTKNNQVLLIPIGKKTWLVGNLKIRHKKNGTYLVVKDDRIVHEFRNKQSAFFYAILEKKQKYQISLTILHNDQLLGRLLEEKAFVIERVKLYKKRDNLFKAQLFTAKLGELENKLIFVKKQLEKNLTLAKYVKVWD